MRALPAAGPCLFLVSVIYFVIAASVPEDMVIREDGSMTGPGGVKIVTETDGAAMSAKERAELMAQAETAAWYLRSLYRALAEDRAGFRDRMLTIMPRVFFMALTASWRRSSQSTH